MRRQWDATCRTLSLCPCPCPCLPWPPRVAACSDVEAGGATSFPRSTGFPLHRALEGCAAGWRNEPAPPPGSPAVVHSMRAKQQRPAGLRVEPREGRAVIFW